MSTLAEVRALASTLPRSYEVLVHGRVKFRVGSIVYLAFSKDEQVMGFAFPKDQRDYLVGGNPQKFTLPSASDMRWHWVHARLDRLSRQEMQGLVLDAWRFVVPKGLAASYTDSIALAHLQSLAGQ